jgi:hypothetical protein
MGESLYRLNVVYNNIPGPVTAAPCGTLIISRGKVGSCPFFFFNFLERAEVSMGGTTGAVSMVVSCCRVRGAMLVG